MPTPKGVPSPSLADRIRDWAAWLAIILIGVAPVVFALLSWETPYKVRNYRNISLPILVMELLLPLLAIMAGCRPVRLLTSGRCTVPLALAGLFTLSGANALLVAVKPDTAFLYLLLNFIHALAALGIYALAIGRAGFSPRMLSAMAAGLGCFAVLVYFLYWTAPELTPETLYYSGAGVTNVRHLSYYGTTGTALALGLATYARDRLAKWLWIAFATLNLAFIIWTGARGGLFALAGMALCAAAFLPNRNTLIRIWCYGAAIIVPASALSLVWIPNHAAYGLTRIFSMSASVSEGAKTFSTDRSELWLGAIQLILDRPSTGHGQGQFKTIAPVAESFYPQPHNFILQFLFDWGVIGTCLAGFVIFTALRLGRRAALAGDAIASVALLGATALLFYGLLDGTLFHVYPLFACSALLTLAAARASLPPVIAKTDNKRP